jgi:NADH dehydrogenase (ubiquinone) Fe-S protein 6
MDKALQESPEEGEKMRVMQAPNRAGVWSRSQQPREKAMIGPRFEQTIMEDQVRRVCALNEGGTKWTLESFEANG